MKDERMILDVMGRRLAAIRQMLGISQGELAEEMKTSQSVISAHEKGISRITHERIVHLIQVHKVNPMFLYGFSTKAFLDTDKPLKIETGTGMYVQL